MIKADEVSQTSGKAQDGSNSSGAEMTESRDLQGTIRIAIVVSHPIQYFAPWYRALALTSGVVVKVFFCSRRGAESYYDRDFRTEVRWDIPLLEGYDWEFLEGRKEIKQDTFWATDNPKVGKALMSFYPDVVVVHGYGQRTMWRVATWCNLNQVPVMLSSDSNGAARRPLWKRAAKAIVVRLFYTRMDGAFSCGDNNRLYHRQYGIPGKRIFEGTLPIDCKGLAASAGDSRMARREIREQYGIPEDAFVVVFAGKLTPLKCPLHLLEALHRCAQKGLNVWGLLVGEGSERSRIEAFIDEQKMENVLLVGFVNQSAIGKHYAASDVVALLSRYEPKGLIIPEAGCFGCPAILSDRIGCIGPGDSARPGENALVYPWSDIDGLTNCIISLYEGKLLYRSMSEAARKIAESQDVTVAALKLKEAAVKLKQIGCRGIV